MGKSRRWETDPVGRMAPVAQADGVKKIYRGGKHSGVALVTSKPPMMAKKQTSASRRGVLK